MRDRFIAIERDSKEWRRVKSIETKKGDQRSPLQQTNKKAGVLFNFVFFEFNMHT